MEFRKFLKSSGALLPGVAVAVCVAGSLSGYEAPVFENALTQVVEASEETSSSDKDTKKASEEGSSEKAAALSLDGTVNLEDCADGTWEGSGEGFRNGKTTVQVTIKNHKMTAIEVVSHQDTDSFFSKAKSSVIDAIMSSQSLEVDTVSGATYSSNGIIEAVSNALKRAAGQPVSDDYSGNDGSSDSESVSVSVSSPDTLTDGTYVGSGAGYGGTTTVSVTVSGGKITSVDVLSHQDTDSYFSMASVLCSLIVQNNGVSGLDAVSGATYSSRGILEAVANALSQAGSSDAAVSVSTSGSSSSGSSSGSVSISVADTPSELSDGTYTGSGAGFGGTTTLSVSVKNGKISGVNVLEHHDTDSYFAMAYPLVSRIVSNNGVSGLDAVSGATYSSRGILEAAANALAKAGASSSSSASGSGTSGSKNSSSTGSGTSGNKGSSSSGNSSSESRADDSAELDNSSSVIKGSLPCPDGTYTGTGEGNGGDIKVSIVIKDQTLTAVTVLSAEDEDEPFITNAKTILSSILLSQSVEVDTISGATYSSQGILDAVQDALNSAAAAAEEEEKEEENTDSSDSETEEDADQSDENSDKTNAEDTEKDASETDESKDLDEMNETDETESGGDSETGPYEDGVYTASILIDPGEDGDFLPYTLSMELTIENGYITSFDNVTGSGGGYDEDDLRYISRALNGTTKYTGIAEQVFEVNGLEGVEAVSGATWTSEGLIEMIRQILLLAAE